MPLRLRIFVIVFHVVEVVEVVIVRLTDEVLLGLVEIFVVTHRITFANRIAVVCHMCLLPNPAVRQQAQYHCKRPRL